MDGSERMGLTRFRGHLSKGGYDGQHGRERAAGTAAIHG